jgi:putative endonuclease
MKPWTVYLVKCSDESLYTGISNDVEKRVKAHNLGKGARYTRGRAPVKIVFSEECEDKSKALIREAEIKKMNRKQKLSLVDKCL